MKRKLSLPLIILIAAMALAVIPACTMSAEGSIKTITKPYITQYDCIEAHIGKEDLLKRHDFITITLLDDKELEVSFKQKGRQKRSYTFPYTYNDKTHELSGEAGILGYKFKEKVVLKNGEFTISKALGKQQLFMKFRAK